VLYNHINEFERSSTFKSVRPSTKAELVRLFLSPIRNILCPAVKGRGPRVAELASPPCSLHLDSWPGVLEANAATPVHFPALTSNMINPQSDHAALYQGWTLLCTLTGDSISHDRLNTNKLNSPVRGLFPFPTRSNFSPPTKERLLSSTRGRPLSPTRGDFFLPLQGSFSPSPRV
jgi:hypothetical protein